MPIHWPLLVHKDTGSPVSDRQDSSASIPNNEKESVAMKVEASQYNPASAINKANAAGQTQTVAQEGSKIERSAAIDPILGDAQSQLAALPDVDMACVAEMKDAISSGKIAINLDSLTESMQKYFQR